MRTDRLSDLVITEVSSVIRIKNSPENVTNTTKKRPLFGLFYKTEGRTVYRTPYGEYGSDPSRAVLMPKGISYEWECEKRGECLGILFDCESTFPAPVSLDVRPDSPIFKRFIAMEKRSALLSPYAGMQNIRDLYDILLSCLDTEPVYSQKSRYEIIAPALRYMTEHYGDTSIRNESLAALCGVSTVYFRKLFSSLEKTSPINYLQSVRIAKAKELLGTGFFSVSEIAEYTGYSGICHFSRMFKAKTGQSPGEYARTKGVRK